MVRFLLELNESIRIAVAQIRANKMRSFLTALGVIIGTVAVTLMGTAINGIDGIVNSSFAVFGEDILYVSKRPWMEFIDWSIIRNRRNIKVEYAQQVNEWIATHPNSALKIAVPSAARQVNVIRGEYRVNNVNMQGTTADSPRITRMEMKEGRFFSDFEAQSGANVAVLGFDVAEALFPGASPVGDTVRIRGQNFRVVGVAARQGSFLGIFSLDSMLVIPISTYRRYLSTGDSAELRVQVDRTRMEEARDELRGLMRRIRQLDPEQRDDFGINDQAAIREPLDRVKGFIGLAGLLITSLALFVGAIGIMNITYVSVKERTREIGTRKALGARRFTILQQFLIEAVMICLIGGLFGLLTARGMTYVATLLVPSVPLAFSVTLVVVGMVVSFATGVLSGFAPAWSASRLDPVVALRYE